MNFKKYVYSVALTAALTFSLTGCNTSDSTYSPQEIIDQAMQETEEATTYYGEYTMDMEDEQPTLIKEWVKDGKRRIELTGADDEHFITVNSGSKITSYDVKKNSAMIFEVDEEELATNMAPSPREQAEMILKMVQDTHDITVEGEEKIAGRDSYHIVAKTQKESTLMGNLELWIDKKTWITLKMISTSGDLTMVTEYKKLDLEAAIDDTQFEIELPADVTIETIDESTYAPNPSTIEEAKAILGSFLQFNEEMLQLVSVTVMGLDERPEFALEYTMDDVPAWSLSILKKDASSTDISTADSPEEELMVRGVKGSKMDMGSFRYIQWEEAGIQYSVIIENPDSTFEEVLGFIEQMELN